MIVFRSDQESSVWAQFAAAALAGVVSQPVTVTDQSVRDWAAIADSMLDQWRKRKDGVR